MNRVELSETFAAWHAGLRDRRAATKVAVAITRLEVGHGDIASVGDRVSEVRIHYGPGYRLYFTRKGDRLIVLLCGGDKGSQARDIRNAKAMVERLE